MHLDVYDVDTYLLCITSKKCSVKCLDWNGCDVNKILNLNCLSYAGK